MLKRVTFSVALLVFSAGGLLYGQVQPSTALQPAAGNIFEKEARHDKRAFMARYGDRRLVRLELRGLKETRPMVIRQWLQVKPGDALSRFDADRFLQDVRNLQIFKRVEIDYRPVNEDGYVLVVSIEEKWSLYPVPVFLYHKDTQLYGAFLVESNFRGTNDGWVLGALGSNRGWQYLAGYKNVNVFYTPYFFWFRSSGGRIYVENADLAGRRLQSWVMDRYDAQYMLGYRFFRRLSLSSTGGVRSASVDPALNTDSTLPPGGGSLLNQGIRLLYEDLHFKYYYEEGFSAQLEYEYGFGIGSDGVNVSNLVGKNRYTLRVYEDTTVTALLNYGYSRIPGAFEHRLGGTPGSRTMPALLIPADRYVNAGFNWQIPFYHHEYFIFTGLFFYDGGLFYRDPVKKLDAHTGLWTNYDGPGVGIRVYLPDIAVPAFGLDLGLQRQTQTIHFSLFLGYSAEL